jgi:hypothetical protein
MLARRVLLTLPTVLLLAAARPTPAGACSPPPPYSAFGVVPRNGATSVPTNVKVRINHLLDEPVWREFIIRPVGGEAVAVTRSELANAFHAWRHVTVLTPDAPLAPATTYEIAGKLRPGCVGAGDCIAETYQVHATFTTGAGPDTTPPTFAGIRSIVTPEREVCTTSGCCGPYTGLGFDIDWDEATDDTGIAAYHIYEGDRRVSVLGGGGFALCSGHLQGGGPGADFVYAESGRYVVRAVDLAGNEDTNDVGIDLVLDCAAGTPAAPNTPLDPNTPRAVAGDDDLDGEGGCAVGGRPAGGWLALFLLLVSLRARAGAARAAARSACDGSRRDPHDRGGVLPGEAAVEAQDEQGVFRPSRSSPSVLEPEHSSAIVARCVVPPFS